MGEPCEHCGHDDHEGLCDVVGCTCINPSSEEDPEEDGAE